MSVVAGSQPGERVKIRVARLGGEIFETEAVLGDASLRAGS